MGPPQLCCPLVCWCCCAQSECSSPSNLATVPTKTIGLLPAGLGIDLTYNKKMFHPTEPDIGDIDPMPVLLIVSQDKAVRSWQLCNLGNFPIASKPAAQRCSSLLSLLRT